MPACLYSAGVGKVDDRQRFEKRWGAVSFSTKNTVVFFSPAAPPLLQMLPLLSVLLLLFLLSAFDLLHKITNN
jgi:hypothetical protein